MNEGAFLFGFLGSAGITLIVTGPMMAVVGLIRPDFVWPFASPSRVRAICWGLFVVSTLGVALLIAGLFLRGNTYSGDMQVMIPVVVAAFFAPWLAVPVWRVLARRIGLKDPGAPRLSAEAQLLAFFETLVSDGPLDAAKFSQLDEKRAELDLPESLLDRLRQ